MFAYIMVYCGMEYRGKLFKNKCLNKSLKNFGDKS